MASADTSLDETGTKIVLSGTNGELAQVDPPENSEHSAQLKKEIPTENEVNSKEPNGSPEPKVKLSSEDYLEKFKLNILFEELIFRTFDNTPENPLKFLLTNLETMERENWEPGESKAEKSEAVAKLFKIPDPESVVIEKSNPKSTGRPGTGIATKGPANTKVGTSQVKTAVKTTPPRPGATSKTVSAKATPAKAAKVVPKTTATPAKTVPKTTVPSTAKPATTVPAKTTTVGAKTGVTGSAAKTGSSGSVAGAKSGTTVGKTAVKSGSNTNLNKTGGSRPTSAPAHTKTVVKAPATKPPVKSSTPRTISSGTRLTKAPTLPKTGTTQTKGKTPGVVADTVSSVTDKSDKSEPIQKTPSPIEEATANTPDEPIIPVDDGVCSKIPGSEDLTAQVLDSEELIALEEAQNRSDDDDENINVVQKSLSVENRSNESPVEIEEVLVVVDSEADRYITSQDYANDIQAIEDEVVQNRQSDDEGIEVNQELTNYPACGLKTADELENPGLYNLSLDPKGFSHLTQANVTIEVTDESGTKQPVITTEEFKEEKDDIPDLNEGDSVKEKSRDLDQDVVITEPRDVINSSEDNQAPLETTPTDTREIKYSEDLGIDVEEQSSPKDSPVLEQALEPTTDQLITVDTDIQPQVERMLPPRYDAAHGILLTDAKLDNPVELIEILQRENEPMIAYIEKEENEPLIAHIEKIEYEPLIVHIEKEENEPLIVHIEKENEPLIAHIEKENEPLIAHIEKIEYEPLIAHIEKENEPLIAHIEKIEYDPLIAHIEKENDPSIDLFQKGNDLLVDPLQQKSLMDNDHSNLSHSPDSDEPPQPQLEPEPIFPASTGDV